MPGAAFGHGYCFLTRGAEGAIHDDSTDLPRAGGGALESQRLALVGCVRTGGDEVAGEFQEAGGARLINRSAASPACQIDHAVSGFSGPDHLQCAGRRQIAEADRATGGVVRRTQAAGGGAADHTVQCDDA